MSTADTPWIDHCHAPNPRAALSGTTDFDVCVIGAGIAGLTTAYALAQAGRSVVVIEARGIGAGETAHTSAHLVSALDDRFYVLERLHGRTGARLAAESHVAAINFIERTVAAHDIDCDFARVNGYLISATQKSEALQTELAAASRAGLSVTYTEAVPGLAKWSGPALCFSGQARFEPMAYLQGLADACEAFGVRIVTHTRVVDINELKEEPQIVQVDTADGAVVRATAVVVATNVPINDRVLLQTKLEAYRTYVLAVRIPQGAFPDVLLWDDADPYHYLRLASDSDGDLLIVGGEDHKTGQGPADGETPHRLLEQWLRERIPQAGEIVHAWSGQIIEPVDSLAYIGLNPGSTRIYVITGDSGNGLTHGTLGGLLVADLIGTVTNPWSELYRPSRMTFQATGEYAAHNANVLRQYGDWLSVGGGPSAEDVLAGEGAIVWDGLHPIAAHRDNAGRLHTCSAVCPHLGGLVRWNSLEKTWDCPCHGSRFSGVGAVLNGPANGGLSPTEVADGSASVAGIAGTKP